MGLRYSPPWKEVDGSWSIEVDGQVIGPFKSEELAREELDRRMEDEG